MSPPLTLIRRLLEKAETELKKFLDPRAGGPDRRGWPLGRFVHLSEIYDLLARQPGMDHVVHDPKLKADSADAWRLRGHAAGELATIALDPSLQIPAGMVSVELPGPA